MISVIIPCYNCEAFIGRAVQSVLNQSYSNWELILVNNNSTDGTKDILHQFQTNYSDRIKVYDQQIAGAPAARNMGLHIAKGEWIQFLDADDELLYDKFEQNIKYLEEYQVDVLAGSFYISDAANISGINEVRTPNSDDPWKSLISSNLGVTSSNLWNASKIKNVGGWDEKLTSSQEYDLLFRLIIEGADFAVDFVPRTILYINTESISQSTDPRKLKRILKNLIDLRLRIKAHLEKEMILNLELEQCIDFFIFDRLMSRKHLAPDLVQEMISELNLNVPLMINIRLSLAYLLKKYKIRK